MEPERKDSSSTTSFARGVLIGNVQPRIWTPPLRELTPETSVGFDQVEFARTTLKHPADPWQEWLFIHAGELQPDGITPRFRIVIVIVARQNGKTECVVILSAYWMFVDCFPMILGTSTKLEYAKETWDKTRNLVAGTRDLDEWRDDKRWFLRGTNGMEMWSAPPAWAEDSAVSRYKVAAANADGGRSLTVDRGIADELRQHRSYEAWNALEPACSPWHAQLWALSNAGDDNSIVLNEQRAAAIRYIETGRGNSRIGLFEWSAPEDADPADLAALAQANPNLGLRKDPATLLEEAQAAKEAGGEQLTGFQTEKMCIRVRRLNPAIDPGAWRRCMEVGTLAALKGRVALCVDVAPDGLHITLVAAAVQDDGRVRVEAVAAWSSTALARAALPALVTRIKPRAFGWFPVGPAAAMAADLRDRRKEGVKWPPPSVSVEEIRAEVPATCMGLAEQVTAGQVVHSDDPLLNDQVGDAERLKRGDGWVFQRTGGGDAQGHVDAVYAMAGAVQLARTLPPPLGHIRLVLPDDD